MTTTTYTFHRASDHAILATADPATLQTTAEEIGRALSRDDDTGASRRVYVHNGKGIVAAAFCRAGRWQDVLRDDYHQFDDVARLKRAIDGYPNDERKEQNQ
jgi:hypothetical protein